MKKIVFAFLCFGITAVYADNCDSARNTYDDIYCTNKIYASADADLNKNYQALRAKLNTAQEIRLRSRSLLGYANVMLNVQILIEIA